MLYAEIDDDNDSFSIRRDWVDEGMFSIAGEARSLADFGPEFIEALRTGKLMAVHDVRLDLLTSAYAETYAKLDVCALLAIPLVKAGKLVIVLSVHAAKPRYWQDGDRQKAQNLAERTWDAVERAIAEKEARDREEKLRQADVRKDEFLAMLAHELRNPLAPISAAAELLQVAKLDETRVRRTSEIIVRQVEHMTSLVNDLLDVSRVTKGLVKLDNIPLDIRHIVTDAVEQVTPLIQARRHHLMLHLAPDTTIVLGDKKRLIQVVANLVNNAAKYTHEGGNILVKTEVHEAHVLLEVVDDGIGMAPDLVARVFDLFSQAEVTPDRSSGGLGLGLSLVKSLVELHGGTVACQSEGLGKGSKFTICLPRLVEPVKLAPQHAEQRLLNAAQSLRVLVVDDNVDAAATLTLLLEATGHKVFVEHGSKRALERARIEKPDVCLLDIGLPEMDGNELAQRLRAQPETANAVLIAVTGYGQEEDRKNTLAAGFNHHLVKPVNTKKLTSILAEVSKSWLHTQHSFHLRRV